MKCVATDVSVKRGLKIKELHRVVQPGEVFEVTTDRFAYLNGNNPLGLLVVEEYIEPELTKEFIRPLPSESKKEPEVVPSEPVEEKPKKKRAVKKNTDSEGVESKPKKSRKKVDKVED